MKKKQKELGFKAAACGPFVRSSYNAFDVLQAADISQANG